MREPKAQKVSVKNPTAKPWKINASISANNPAFKSYFQGKEYLEVPPNSQADYEIVYFPLTMTANPEVPSIKVQDHQGSLFFPIPDGTALLYNLVGRAAPAGPLQTFDCSLKAKKAGFQIIPIKNWLKQSQRFNVTWKIDPNEKSIIINGAQTFDIAGEGVKDYKLSIYGLKPMAAKI